MSSLRSKSTTEATTLVVNPFKDQESANIVKIQLKDLIVKLRQLSNRCLRAAILPRSSRSTMRGWCVTSSVTNAILVMSDTPVAIRFLRVDEHRNKTSSVRKHYDNKHAGKIPDDLCNCFNVLKKCQNKFDCLVNKMLLIKQLRPCLNVQSDSIRTRVFV